MKVVTASGKQSLSISREEWQKIGEKAGWIRTAAKPKSHKCSGCGEPSGDVDLSVREWICKKCKQHNRFAEAGTLTFPERLEKKRDESPSKG